MPDRNEIAACVLEPHFDAVRDTFAAFEPEPGVPLTKLGKVKLEVTDRARDAERHYARCREDGMLIQLAPATAEDLELDQVVALISHEMGHATDFLYPGSWVLMEPRSPRRRVVWIGGRDDRKARQWRQVWLERDTDEVEWAADAIAKAVTGLEIGYCGSCMVQCFGGKPRPAGLR